MLRKVLRRLVRGVRRPSANVVTPPAPPSPPLPPVTPVPEEQLGEQLRYLSENIPLFAPLLEQQRNCLRAWNTPTLQCLPPSSYQDKDVLEIGCGIGVGCALYLACGARSAWGFDPTLTESVLTHLRVLPRARFTPAVLTEEAVGESRFDLIYAHFVSEHVGDLLANFALVHKLLRPGGRFVGLHANYYGPLGGHDHAFIDARPTPHGILMYSRAVRCWESPVKCDASAAYRKECEARPDWRVADWQLTPEDCSHCLYYQRAQLWGHLIYQDEFTRNYPGTASRCGVDGGLNKLTPFQVRQLLIEAGFRVAIWVLDAALNEPPAALLERFTATDLKVSNILFAVDRAR
ncbi:MAG TPA: class I SAM-dependent methyltransferase [Gemmataceae bacterium]|nr:class I SAM-dependent methyltransferase [Gemmataceae bacterium]